METTKSIFASKTFWFNVVAGLLGLATALTPDTLTSLGIDGVAQTRILFVIGGIATVGNIVLRSITSTAVTTPITK